MSATNLKNLIAKLNTTCQQALEAAAGVCVARTHYNIEIEHWLLKLLGTENNDLLLILNHYGIVIDTLLQDLQNSLERLKTGNVRAPSLSQSVVDWCREAWLLTTLEYELSQTRSGILLLALLQDDSLARIAQSISRQFAKIPIDSLRTSFFQIIENSTENQHIHSEAGNISLHSAQTKTPALDQYTVDLTEQARQGRIDPVIGRDNEIRQIIDILTRRRQNNPILTGEAGVGKTAVVEGFALRVVKGDVPSSLKDVAIRCLDLGLLQAGAGVKGEFENRLKSVINEIKKSLQPVILFIDEAHTLIGAGGQAGQGDAANLLKPELARGELRTIAATTWSEYKKYFEQDAALVRRFQVIKIDEPSVAQATSMLQGMVAMLEEHHKVRIQNEAISEAARLSDRYLYGRQLPDKAVSLLDTACAKVAISNITTPAAIEDYEHQIAQLKLERSLLLRDKETGIEHVDEFTLIDQNIAKLEDEYLKLQQQWQQERECIQKMHELYQVIVGNMSSTNDTKIDKLALQQQLMELTKKLKEIQGERPLMQPWVDGQVVAEIIGNWTGIPVGRMVRDEIHTLLKLKENLQKRIIGQSHALQAVAESIQTSRAKMTDPRKPIGIFLFVGTSGVGKTETALALAELLYGSQQNLTTINMSEFKEEHKVSTLVGAPPGYVGYGQGGVLTEAVRRRPYSLILLDEMEKAHPGVQDVFYQIFDKGIIRDSEGRDIDFKNTIIIMTSNACSDLITKLCADPETMPDSVGLTEALQPELLKIFKPAFLGRVQIIPYFPLDDINLRKIIELQLSRIKKRIFINHQAEFTYTTHVVDYILQRCQQVETGARTIEHLLNTSLLPELSTKFLLSMADGKKIKTIHIDAKEGGFNYVIH